MSGKAYTLNRQTKRQLYNRSRLVRQWLMSELRVAAFYSKDRTLPISPAEKAYRERVVEAYERTRVYMRNFNDNGAHEKFMEYILCDHMTRTAIYEASHICKNTYDNWRSAMIRAFGAAMGIWI